MEQIHDFLRSSQPTGGASGQPAGGESPPRWHRSQHYVFVSHGGQSHSSAGWWLARLPGRPGEAEAHLLPHGWELHGGFRRWVFDPESPQAEPTDPTREAVERLERKVNLLSSQVTALIERIDEREASEEVSRSESSVPALAQPSFSQATEITGLGDRRAELLEPIPVTIEILGDKVIVSDEHVNMYGSGTTLNEALLDYRTSLLEYLEWLASNEATLAAHLREHLEWLRARVQRVESA